MNRIIEAELGRLARRRTIVIAAAASLLFALVTTYTVFSSAQVSSTNSRRSGATLSGLAGSGGGTEALAIGASFAGLLVLVTFIALIAAEFTGGTFRALLLRDPHRLRVIIGKLIGLLIFAAAVVALIEVLTFVAALILAPTQDISTAEWFSADSAVAAVQDYLTVFGGVAGWAVFGATLAVVFRSAPIALGVGFAWVGPFENIVVDSWNDGYRYFPGQVLASLIRGGTTDLGIERASLTAALYACVAAALMLVLVSRRDVTA
jgi:ABC-2 type transport system permease protein